MKKAILVVAILGLVLGVIAFAMTEINRKKNSSCSCDSERKLAEVSSSEIDELLK